MARTDPRPNYGTKRRVKDNGYLDIWKPDHPLARADGYVYEHRKVAWDNGIITDRRQHVHHINADKTDNRPENLAATTSAEHQRTHLRDRGTVRNQYGVFRTYVHPSLASYMRGCRCEGCRACNAERQRNYLAKRRVRVTVYPVTP